MAIMSWSHYFFNEQKIKKTWHNFLARTVFCVFSGYKFSGLREILGFDQMFSILFLLKTFWQNTGQSHLESFLNIGEDTLVPRVKHQLANDALLAVFGLGDGRGRLALEENSFIKSRLHCRLSSTYRLSQQLKIYENSHWIFDAD